MLVGVLSDVHDHIENLRRALSIFEERRIGTLIFCGDFCSPIPATVLGGYAGTVHCVFGNGDGDRAKILAFSRDKFTNLEIHGEHAELDLNGEKVAVTHYPLYGQALARTGDYAAVFSGHTHQLREERFGECLWLNPGDVMGWNGRATVAVYDTDSNSAEIIDLD